MYACLFELLVNEPTCCNCAATSGQFKRLNERRTSVAIWLIHTALLRSQEEMETLHYIADTVMYCSFGNHGTISIQLLGGKMALRV